MEWLLRMILCPYRNPNFILFRVFGRRLRCLSSIAPRPWRLSLIGWGIGEGEDSCIVGVFVQLFGVFLCSIEGLCSSYLVLFLVAFLETL